MFDDHLGFVRGDMKHQIERKENSTIMKSKIKKLTLYLIQCDDNLGFGREDRASNRGKKYAPS